MNLHIVPDSKFSQTFYNNLHEGNLLLNNKIVVRTHQRKPVHVAREIPFAKLYSRAFDDIIGDTVTYEKVYIHQFSPLMYRWVAGNSFQELNWMIWGTDLYNLSFINYNFYEPFTRAYMGKYSLRSDFLYLLKVYLTNMPFKTKAYSKISHVLTWMQNEFQFATKHISSLKAGHLFFFYENQLPYNALDKIKNPEKSKTVLKIIVGNSGTPTNNHLDAIQSIADSGIRADLYIPTSYGDKKYVDYLKKNVSFYQTGRIEFIDRFMPFEEYIQFLSDADALVMNHIRPQGYGNIFMMMYLGKPIFLNKNNLSLSDLHREGITWNTLDQLKNIRDVNFANNKDKVARLLSHERLIKTYHNLFG